MSCDGWVVNTRCIVDVPFSVRRPSTAAVVAIRAGDRGTVTHKDERTHSLQVRWDRLGEELPVFSNQLGYLRRTG